MYILMHENYKLATFEVDVEDNIRDVSLNKLELHRLPVYTNSSKLIKEWIEQKRC